MVKKSYSPAEFDQNDEKVFKETIGTFGTTTKPGGNQLLELQTKIRQGIKHVELHLAGTGKGNFGVLDVPDKYGFEQRRTIMQLAKLNNQTLSVHGTFDVVDFSGLSGNSGVFDDAQRSTAIKEIDETLKFAAETAKGGAVVFHIQGAGVGSSDRSELNIPKSYLNWLKKNNPPEYERLKQNYLKPEILDREFVSDIYKVDDVISEFKKLNDQNSDKFNSKVYNDYLEKFDGDEVLASKKYYEEKVLEKKKLNPDMTPMVVVGDKISGAKREEDFINISKLKENYEKEKEILRKLGLSKNLSIDDVYKLKSFLSSNYGDVSKISNISEDEFNKLKENYLINYEKELEKNDYLTSEADLSIQKKFLDFQNESLNLQEKEIDSIYEIHKEDYEKLKKLEEKRKDIIQNLSNYKYSEDKLLDNAVKEKLKIDLENLNREILELTHQKIGVEEYSMLKKRDEMKLDVQDKKKLIESQIKDLESVTEKVFNKNVSAIAHLGIKALRYQLDLKKKAKEVKGKVEKFDKDIENLKKKIENEKSFNDKQKYLDELEKLEYERNKLVGLKDYEDIDLKNRPLYLAPENMLPGYGPLTSVEEYKAVLRMSQEEFANRILSDDPVYKNLKEEYEKETGIKIETKEDAKELAKRHLAGTFDTAHAGTWIKHFKPLPGESEENRIDRFNKWLIEQGESMVKEGLVKHIHFNDSAGKDDDHSLIGDGILDMVEMRQRLRKAGIDEALIVEAGGRGNQTSLQVTRAFQIFNPTLSYNGSVTNSSEASSGVSDWSTVERNYHNRKIFSDYGMGYSTFRHTQPQQGVPKGNWSGRGFL
jgi:hypothetical protein